MGDHEASVPISPVPQVSTCGQLTRSLGTFVSLFSKARGLRHQSCCLILQLYLWNRTSFIVPIFGDPLVPAAPYGPGQHTLHALLGGQHEPPEEAAHLAD